MKTTIPVSTLLHQKSTAIWSIEPNATVFEAIKLMANRNIGALLVMSSGTLAGVFTERDYTRKVALHGKTSRETHVWEVMTEDVITVSPDESIEDCMRLMTEHRVRHLPVTHGIRVIGIVSIGDLVNWTISTQDAAIEQMERYIAGVAA